MGPYCRYCGSRCFVPVLESDALAVRAVYIANGLAIGATCPLGAALERDTLGVSLAESRAQKKGGENV